MKSKTLEELKRENAEKEVEPETEPEEAENEALDELDSEEPENVEDDADEPEDDNDIESWMQSEEQTSESGQSVPVATHVNVKRKLKGKITQKDDEINKLRQEIESLKNSGIRNNAVEKVESKPKYEDYQHLDNPEEAYADALTDWKLSKFEAKQEAQMIRNRQESESRRMSEQIESSVDQHYERAEKLIAKAGISPDKYQQADIRVRQALEAIRPNQGDLITDQLIAELGDGSEKVMFYLGSNESVLATLQSKLVSNPSGLSAMAYLAELKATKAAPKSKQSRAPKPAPDIRGDSKPVANEKKLKKAYQNSSGQERWNIRKQAREAGYNVNEW